ncbi:protein phosphatase 1E-like [Anneissia japonica]|uniref:protein phosphatase 1E-like n=1 Tax=Anneissia japonica TaxID=1529436 RepID=UPI0014258F82|nr:protein phosphatase 1E-like [Anneissia japonica]
MAGPQQQGCSVNRAFLEEFVANHSSPLDPDEPLPIRLVTYYLTDDEVEGEVVDWTLEYLRKNNAPSMLALEIARETVDAVLKVDLSSYIEERQDFEETSMLICADKVAKVVFNKVHEICKEWKDNPPSDYSPTPKVSTHAIKNTRRKMEDKHITIPDLNRLRKKNDECGSPVGFYAVYDGHGGIDASHYAATHLHCHVVSNSEFKSNKANALRAGFTVTDDKFVDKAKREGLRSGTTGIAIVHDGDMLHVGWIGDSQALVMKQGRAITVMNPHKPDREDEKKRIEELGGCVVWFGAWRVNGSLAVSRAIGDADHRPYVSGTPDVTSVKLDGDEDCFVLACDGLFDTVSLQDVCDVVQNCINTDSEYSTVSHKLVSVAKERGSTDNITCIVVFLNPQKREISSIDEDEKTVILDDTGNPVLPDDSEEENNKPKDESEGEKSSDRDGSQQPGNTQETSTSEQIEAENIEAEETETKDSDCDTNSNNNNSMLLKNDSKIHSASNSGTGLSNPKNGHKNVPCKNMETLSLAGNGLKLSPSPKLNRKKKTSVSSQTAAPTRKSPSVNTKTNVVKNKKLTPQKKKSQKSKPGLLSNGSRSTSLPSGKMTTPTQSTKKPSSTNDTNVNVVSPVKTGVLGNKSNQFKSSFKPKTLNSLQGRVHRDEVIPGATMYNHVYQKGSVPAYPVIQ